MPRIISINYLFYFYFLKATAGIYFVCSALRTQDQENLAGTGSARSRNSSLLNESKRAKSTAEASARRLMLIQLMLL